MEYLHKNKEEFRSMINLTSQHFHVLPVVAEKDYYVTMILRELSQRLDYIVFKGGTSLSKCYRIIKRFSEDIDITIDSKLSQGQMEKLKEVIKDVADELDLSIPNIDETRSRRSYNRYILEYESVLDDSDDAIQSAVLLETSFAEIAFLTAVLDVHSLIGRMIAEADSDQLLKFCLDPFGMKVQGLDRTLIDKVFAICDYYMNGQEKKHSRHIYDIYKILPSISLNEDFRALIKDVRKARAQTKICPSAQPDVDVSEMLNLLIENKIYKDDYIKITSRILEEDISYDMAIKAVKDIADSKMFS